MTNLLELAAKVEAAEGPDRELDAEIWLACTPGATRDQWSYIHNATGRECHVDETRDASHRLVIIPAYTSSVDAAMMLVPEGWFWRVGHSTLYAGWAHLNRKHPDFCNREDEHSAQAAAPALALTAASLKARSENPA